MEICSYSVISNTMRCKGARKSRTVCYVKYTRYFNVSSHIADHIGMHTVRLIRSGHSENADQRVSGMTVA